MLSSVLNNELDKKLANQPKLIEHSHCADIVSAFAKIVQKTIEDDPTRSTYVIPFPAPCGHHIKKLIDSENIHNPFPLKNDEMERANALILSFQLINKKVSVYFSEKH
jgi:hypothetical protein